MTAVPLAFGPRLADALTWAAILHRAQERKGHVPVPYLGHLLGVASLVVDFGGSEDQAIAALLHDSIEDQGVTDALLVARYGADVARIVRACTDTDQVPKPPWRDRKVAYIAHVAEVDADVLLVSLADKTNNARAIATDIDRHGESYFRHFTGGPDGTRWYYRRMADALAARLDAVAVPGGAGERALLAELEHAASRFGATAAAATLYEATAYESGAR